MNTKETFLSFRSVLSKQEKENMKWKRLLRRTEDSIKVVERRLSYLKRVRRWVERILYENREV